MTGLEFYEVIHNADQITDLGWIEYGEAGNPERTSITFRADEKDFEIFVAKETDEEDTKFMSYASIALLLNKVFEQTGEKQRVHAGYGQRLGEVFAFFAMKKLAEFFDDDAASLTYEDFRSMNVYPEDIEPFSNYTEYLNWYVQTHKKH